VGDEAASALTSGGLGGGGGGGKVQVPGPVVGTKAITVSGGGRCASSDNAC
jgi:hypothetical protein